MAVWATPPLHLGPRVREVTASLHIDAAAEVSVELSRPAAVALLSLIEQHRGELPPQLALHIRLALKRAVLLGARAAVR